MQLLLANKTEQTKETIVHQQSMECFIDELKSTNEPLLYVSFDNHQRLYKKLVNTGISVTVLPLDRLKIDHTLTVT